MAVMTIHWHSRERRRALPQAFPASRATAKPQAAAFRINSGILEGQKALIGQRCAPSVAKCLLVDRPANHRFLNSLVRADGFFQVILAIEHRLISEDRSRASETQVLRRSCERGASCPDGADRRESLARVHPNSASGANS